MLKQATTKLTIIAIAFCCNISGHASAQDIRAKEPITLGTDAGIDDTDCETTKALLDLVAINSGTDKSIIIIAANGMREPTRKINSRRLSQLRSFLEMTRGISKQRVITAEEERARGLGHVKIYVGGELQVIFTMKRNKGFFGAGCYS